MFVTTNTVHRNPLFSDPANAYEAVAHLYQLQLVHPFFLFAFVVMPDHCHFLLNIPSPGRISTLMNVYKSGLTFQLGLGKIWQPRFHILIPRDPWKVVEYIHRNPVKKGLSQSCEDYPWSSACGKWDVTRLD